MVIKLWRLVKIRLSWRSSFLIIFNLLFFLRLCITQIEIFGNILFLCNLLFLQRQIRLCLLKRSLFWSNLILSTLKQVILLRQDGRFPRRNIRLRRRFRPGIRARVWIWVWPWARIQTRLFLKELPLSVSSVKVGVSNWDPLLGWITAGGSGCTEIWFAWWEVSPYSIKDMPEFFWVGVVIRTILTKHVSSFAYIAQHHLFHEKDTPCDSIIENNFSWEHRWILLHGKSFEMSFTVLNVPIKLVPAFKHRHGLSKIGESSLLLLSITTTTTTTTTTTATTTTTTTTTTTVYY